MFENSVLIKLVENYKEISYWSEPKSEVDFIVEKTAINVTAANKMLKREIEGLEDFNKRHKGFTLMILSKALKKENVMPLIEFLKR